MKIIDFNNYEARKKFAIHLIIGTLFFIAASIVVNFELSAKANQNQNQNQTPISNSEKSTSSSTSTTKRTYIIKSYNGKVAAFESGNDEPFRVTNILIDELPNKDREILTNGLEVDSQKELIAILEDYCS